MLLPIRLLPNLSNGTLVNKASLMLPVIGAIGSALKNVSFIIALLKVWELRCKRQVGVFNLSKK